ncbi:carboxypeptidase regulatory-like domain-containing protein, partial [Candidatus Dependentiae bacterium]|nr:carboxypeptidase regulatory-like domain-containing protein [Candidatus Dependentiae bacterium]
MKKQLSFFFLFVCLIISFPLICYCESTGSIKGQVINQETKEPISGAVVIIKADEFERSVVTDKSGLYSIEGVKEKSVNIKVVHLDYFIKEVSNIELQKDSVTTIDIELKKKKKEEIVIYTPVHPDIKFDNFMLTIPTAYVIPSGGLRVQL